MDDIYYEQETERPPPTFKIDSEGNYVIIANSLKPPTAISGNFYKLGHIIKVILVVRLLTCLSEFMIC